MPYSGLLIAKDSLFHFNIKGFSRYIWDFESSATENTKGRYLSYGQIEYFDLKNKYKSFNPEESDFDWNYIPGATTKVLPEYVLQDKGGSSSGHRNFSDETFLTGVHGSKKAQCFLSECMILLMTIPSGLTSPFLYLKTFFALSGIRYPNQRQKIPYNYNIISII